MPGEGAPTKLTPERKEKIVSAIRAGNYYRHAAAFAGVSHTTLYTWLERGRDERRRIEQDEKPRKTEAIYLDFLDAVERAEAEAVIEAVAHWKSATREDWRAAKEWLARRHSDEWGDKAKLEHSGPDGGAITLAGLESLMGVDDDPRDD